ncbi:MAG: pentapeptide repeat-containing protein [Elainella sp.]
MTTPHWTLWQADLKEMLAPHLALPDQAETGNPAAKGSVEQLLLVLSKGQSLLAALALPLPEQAKLGQVFRPLAVAMLQRYSLSLTESVSLLLQALYLDCWCELLAGLYQDPSPEATPGQTAVNPPVNAPVNRCWLEPAGQPVIDAAFWQQLNQVTALPLEETDTRQAVVNFSGSRLAQRWNQLLMARLAPLELEATLLKQLVQQTGQATEAVLWSGLEQSGPTVWPWIAWYRDPDPAQLERYLQIDTYLNDQIAARPNELVFNEAFSLKELYLPLQAQPLTATGEPDLDLPPVDLETWVKEQLRIERSPQVLLVQAGFGRGKTTFCRMFADWVRQQDYPRWTPILISLQEVSALPKTFEAFLQQTLPPQLTADPDWLTQPQIRFLFLLDGFSELHLDNSSSLEQFFEQVGRFQEECASHPDMGHRVLLTGRSLMIKSLERLLPPNLLRVEMLPLNADLQDQWLNRWSQLTGTDRAGLKPLQNPELPKHSLDLTREPLMLYFLAAMQQDGSLRLSPLVEASPDRAKFLLYQQIFYWALATQRPGLLNRSLSAAEIESLRRLLAEAGLWTVQLGTEAVPLASLAARLQHDQGIQTLIRDIQTQLQSQRSGQPLSNALVTLYERAGQIYLRFTHNSFGKLFCSRRLHEALEDWATTLTRRRQTEPLVPVETLHWQMFDLMGYGGLTPEMTEYLMVLFNANPEADTTYLFQRLEDFYHRWASGTFADAPPETLPQKAARLLRQARTLMLPPSPVAIPQRQQGQRQVDVFTGLNVMIVLLQLYGYARSQESLQERIVFYPCGRQGTAEFAPDRLLQIIGYSHCVSPSAFRTIVGPYLSSANLSGVNLSGVNLRGVDLSNADLRGADLSGANLRGANLSRANLVGTSLDGADLSNADLRGANLIGANLRGADLSHAAISGADLSGANLIGASLSLADLRDADLSGAYLRGASLQSAVLSRAYLIGASLSGASLSHADLEQVDLSDANLHGADLSDANLHQADLQGADLIGAYLNGAYLCGAILCRASLNSADLIGADLCGADLSSANLIGADLSDHTIGDVKWSERTKWQDVRGLEAAINVPEALKQQLGLAEMAEPEL